MTPADILNRHLICLVGVAPVTPGACVVLRIRIRLKPRERSARAGVLSLLP